MACQRFLQRQKALVQFLSALPRHAVPDELELRVATEVTSAPRCTALLGTLARISAPDVLDRLVAEELADPATARAARFAGSLRRASAPQELSLRVHRGLAPLEPRPRSRRLGLATAGLLTAAAVLFWMAPRPSVRAVGDDVYPFRVVRASSLADLDPLARALVDGLTGGAVEIAEGGNR
jgi:hypothetical protein